MRNQGSYSSFGLQEAQQLFEAYSTAYSEKKISFLIRSVLGEAEAQLEMVSYRSLLNETLMYCYPNETAIKTSFIDNVILRQSSNAVSVFELPVGESRADICKVNGHSAAYEIKTDLDSFYRLEKQLDDYFDVFDYVYVVTSDKRWKSLPDFVPETCGIYSYHQKRDGRYAFSLRRKPQLIRSHDGRKQLEAIPKRDIVSAFKLQNGVKKDEAIELILEKCSDSEINRAFKDYLKGRYSRKWDFFKSVHSQIFEIDYEWFFRNNLEPSIIY